MNKNDLVFSRFDNYLHFEQMLQSSWETFLSDGVIQEGLRSIIKTSWKRCKDRKVNPLRRETTIDQELFYRKKEENAYLLQSSLPFMNELYYMFENDPISLVLTDSDGIILETKGNRHVLSKLEQLNFMPGGDWSEPTAGTNAIGTALEEKRPTQVFSAEHFCQGWHPWVCSSTPIFDPFTRETIGVLNITGEKNLVNGHNIKIIGNIARKIEQSFGAAGIKQNLAPLFSLLNSIQDPFIIFDRHGVVTYYNEQAKYLLKIKKGFNISTIIHDFQIDQKISLNDFPKRTLTMGNYEWEISVHDYLIGTIIMGGILVFKRIKPLLTTKIIKETHYPKYSFENLITKDPTMIKVIETAKKASFSNHSILIQGETGTGKELIAQSIHAYNSMKGQPFIAVNCGAIPKEMIASELFGYEGGAFTGANPKGKKGKIMLANEGTLFLDEVGELPLDLQVYLLRVLEEKEISPIGSIHTYPVEFQLISATHQNLKEKVKLGQFREDLYYRLNVISLQLSPLRKRKQDIQILIKQFLEESDQRSVIINDEAMNYLLNYDWPGNIRELKNCIKRSVFYSTNSIITPKELPIEIVRNQKQISQDVNESSINLKEEITKEVLLNVINKTNGNITSVAKRLNVSRMTIYRKMKQFGLN